MKSRRRRKLMMSKRHISAVLTLVVSACGAIIAAKSFLGLNDMVFGFMSVCLAVSITALKLTTGKAVEEAEAEPNDEQTAQLVQMQKTIAQQSATIARLMNSETQPAAPFGAGEEQA